MRKGDSGGKRHSGALAPGDFRRLLEEWPPALLMALLVASVSYRLVRRFKSFYVVALSALVALLWRLRS